MFFLCFSGRDRFSIVQSILYHLQKFGLNLWYDNHEYILGDNKVVNFTRGIYKSDYAIVVISPYFPDSPGAIEELDVIKTRYDAGLIHVFPIFYRIYAKDIPQQFKWLCDLIYNELDVATGTLLTCNQIVCKYFLDLLERSTCKTIGDVLGYKSELPPYCLKTVECYLDVVPTNINSRLSLLYSLFLYFETELQLPPHLTKTAHYLFLNTKLNLEYNFKEIILMEQAICLAIDYYIMSNRQ